MKHSVAMLIVTALLACLNASVSRAADAPAAATSQPSGSGMSAAGAHIKGPEQDNVVVDDRTEAVIKGALKYLASKQTPNGSWNAGGGQHKVAMTAYTLMAFMACGNVPNEGEYGKNVARGTQYLLDSVSNNPEGYINANEPQSNMYGHGIATIALAEVYGQTRDPKIKPKLESAIKLIVNCQNQAGGWRYRPAITDADISVTVLQCVALRAAKNAGIDVPQQTIDNAVKFVRSCYDEKSGGFCYQPHSGPGFARTAAAIYSLQVCGIYDDPMVAKGSQYLINLKGGEANMFCYGHFYAAPAQYMIGGDTWKTWYEHINKTLMEKVKREGDICYWDIDTSVGPLYATAICTTILAMPYHYIPLYQR